MVRVFENLMSRNDEMEVWSSPGLETHLFLSHVDCISSIMMTQIKKNIFFAIFNLCPILTCPGMTKHYGHLGFGHNMFYIFLFGTEIICPSYPLSGQIIFFSKWFPKLEMSDKGNIMPTNGNNGQAIKLSKLRFSVKPARSTR